MKIKILLAPALVVTIVVLLIWFIYPTFTNPVSNDGVMEKSAELEKDKAHLTAISQKSDLINNLAQSLNSSQMSSNRETIMNFLPDKIKEYEIIDNINYLVLKDGLLGTAISVIQPENPVNLPIGVSMSGQDINNAVGTTEPAEITPVATTFKVEFAVQGSYDNIKDIFQKIYGLKRYNRVLSMKIEPVEKDNKGSNNLKATATFEFAYFDESGKFNTIEDSVFSKTNFDTQVANTIETKKDTALLPPLQVDQKGKTNPFIP